MASTAGGGDAQCRALTEEGQRCSRPAGDDGFCYQHDPGDETVDDGRESPDGDDGGATDEDETRTEITMASTDTEIADTEIGQVRGTVTDVAAEVVGYPLDGITSIDHTDDGWRVAVEVVERKSVPDTQDILGRYEIRLDGDLTVTGYQRTHRYRRDDMDHDI